MKKTAINIQYDTDGEVVDLPSEIEIDIPNGMTDEEEIEEFISDEISNVTGFCHTGFSIK
jgi:hypothetical protein